MSFSNPTSGHRFDDYKDAVKARHRGDAPAFDEAAAENPLPMAQKRNLTRQRTAGALVRAFLDLIRGHRMTLGLALGSLSVATLLGLMPWYGTKIIIDSVLSQPPRPVDLPAWVPLPEERQPLLVAVTLGMMSLTVVSLLIGIWGRWQATRTSKRVQVSVRKRVFNHSVRLPLHRVYELKSGGVASILRDDAGGVGELVFSMVYNPWKAVTQLVGSIAILAWTDWRLLVGAFVLMPIAFYTHRTWVARIRPLYKDIRQTRQQVDSHATEAFGGMRVVRGFSRQRSESNRFTRNNNLMARQELYTWWWSRTVDIIWQLLIPTCTAAVFWYGGMRILADQVRVAEGVITPDKAMTVGDLVMFITYIGWLLGPMATLASSATQFQNNLAGLDRVLDVLDEPTEVPTHGGAIRLDPAEVRGEIRLRDLSFHYPRTNELALKNINLLVQPGQMVALVGPSGAGKTTLCNLIARFYDPSSGAIELDGRDLRDIQTDSYRNILGIVEQDVFLFDGSIAANIGYGRRGATREQIMEAARLAHAHEFILELPRGYQTRIGERGVKLSGGQRQRLTIARAILADPRILILDEATSNLDTHSERLIQQSMQSLMMGRTSFVIAHRLSTIAHADLIVVIEDGQIAEQGTHQELMDRSGSYERMVTLQTSPVVAAKAAGVSPAGA